MIGAIIGAILGFIFLIIIMVIIVRCCRRGGIVDDSVEVVEVHTEIKTHDVPAPVAYPPGYNPSVPPSAYPPGTIVP